MKSAKYEFVSKNQATVGDIIKYSEAGKEYPAKVCDKMANNLMVKVIGLRGDHVKMVTI